MLLAAPVSTAAQAERPRVIEELVVTAQKKEQSIQDVPISITALTGDFLKEAGIGDLHELAEFTPNVRFLTNACCTMVFIRGFGTPFSAGAFDPTVGLVLDELSIVKQVHMSDPIYDIERFEVLRGPQGTLFGKNTPAGLFNVTTGAPSEEFEGYVLGRFGGLGVHRVEAAVGGPLGALGNVVRFRLAAVELRQAADLANTTLGGDLPPTEQQAGRLKLEIRPLDGLEILVIGSLAHTESGYYFHVQNDSVPQATLDFLRQYDARVEDDPFDHRLSFDYEDQGVERETDLLQTNVRWSPGDAGWLREPEVVAVLGTTGVDQQQGLEVDFSPADILKLEPTPNSLPYEQRSIEIRAAGTVPGPLGIGTLDVLVGGQLFEADVDSDNPLIAGRHLDEYLFSPAGFELVTGAPPPGGVGFTDLNEVAVALGVPPPLSADALEGDGGIFFLRQDTTSQALFGRAAWKPFEQWEVSFGARLTSEKKRARIKNDCLAQGFVCALLGMEEFDVVRSRSETDFSPKVTLQYFPWDGLTLFATRGQGFKSGGFNNFSFTSAEVEVDSEKAVSWEVGAKGTSFEEALSWSATLFNMDVDDLQLQNAIGAVVTVRNAASARSRGLEVDFQWLAPWEPLSVRGAGALTDGKFKEFRDAPPVAGSGVESQDLSGKRMPLVPERQLMVTPELRFTLPAVFGLELAWTAALDVLYRSAFFLDTDLDPHTLQDDYATLGARLGVATADEAFSVVISVDNATDADVLEYDTDSLVFPGAYLALQEFQRNYAFQARYQW